MEELESRLLRGGKNITDHTNEQQRELEKKRSQLAEQKRREREMLQLLEKEEENTCEIASTFTSLQQEVEAKTAKLKKMFSRLQAVKQEIVDLQDEFSNDRADMQQTQEDLTKELKLKSLIIENFIPPEEKKKIINRAFFDEDEDCWKLRELMQGSPSSSVLKRPVSSSTRRPISEYAKSPGCPPPQTQGSRARTSWCSNWTRPLAQPGTGMGRRWPPKWRLPCKRPWSPSGMRWSASTPLLGPWRASKGPGLPLRGPGTIGDPRLLVAAPHPSRRPPTTPSPGAWCLNNPSFAYIYTFSDYNGEYIHFLIIMVKWKLTCILLSVGSMSLCFCYGDTNIVTWIIFNESMLFWNSKNLPRSWFSLFSVTKN